MDIIAKEIDRMDALIDELEIADDEKFKLAIHMNGMKRPTVICYQMLDAIIEKQKKILRAMEELNYELQRSLHVDQ